MGHSPVARIAVAGKHALALEGLDLTAGRRRIDTQLASQIGHAHRPVLRHAPQHVVVGPLHRHASLLDKALLDARKRRLAHDRHHRVLDRRDRHVGARARHARILGCVIQPSGHGSTGGTGASCTWAAPAPPTGPSSCAPRRCSSPSTGSGSGWGDPESQIVSAASSAKRTTTSAYSLTMSRTTWPAFLVTFICPTTWPTK